MIFLTIGSHEPFDRLVRALDAWAGASGREARVFGQITARARYIPEHFDHVATLTPAEYAAHCADARLIVSHAGMGTILTALQAGTPALLFPRRASLGETRNDHQIATAKKFYGRQGLTFVMDQAELPHALDAALASGGSGAKPLSSVAEVRLTDAIRNFIFKVQT